VGLFARATAHAQQPVEIVTPEDGAVVPPDFSVKITYEDLLFGDTDTWDYFPPDGVALRVDNKEHKMCSPCPADEVTFDVMLPAGPHQLQGHAWLDFGFDSGEYSDPIMIMVEQATTSGASSGTDATSGSSGEGETAGTGTEANTTSGDGATGSSATDGGSDKSDGCACDVKEAPRGTLAWLGTVFLAVPRRGRRRS
jgi:hypothetical protein